MDVLALPVYQVPLIHSPDASIVEVDTVIAVGIALVFTVSVRLV